MVLSDPRLLNFPSLTDCGGLWLTSLANPPVSTLSLREMRVAVFFRVSSLQPFVSASSSSDTLSLMVSRPLVRRGSADFYPSELGSVVWGRLRKQLSRFSDFWCVWIKFEKVVFLCRGLD